MTPYEIYMRKQAFWPEVATTAAHMAMAAPMLHVGTNALLQLKNRFIPQMAEALANKGVAHGLSGVKANPLAEDIAGHAVGFENAAEYHLPRMLAKKMVDSHGPALAHMGLQSMAEHPFMKDLAEAHPAFGHIREAMANAGPIDGAASGLHVNENADFPQSRRALSAGMAISGIVASPHVGAQFLVNKGRQAIGNSTMGQSKLRGWLADGIDGPQGAGKRLLRTYAGSPMVGQIQDLGHAVATTARKHGIAEEHLTQLRDNIRSGGDLHTAMSDFISHATSTTRPPAQKEYPS